MSLGGLAAPVQRNVLGEICTNQENGCAPQTECVADQSPGVQNSKPREKRASSSKMPVYVKKLEIQVPDAGHFTVNHLTWQHVESGHTESPYSLVAAIPHNRLYDFLGGEEDRGKCFINLNNKNDKKRSKHILLKKESECIFGSVRSSEQKERQNMMASDEPKATKTGKKGRHNKLQDGTSCKMDCSYRFFAVRYDNAHRDKVILRFPATKQDTAATCRAMKHLYRSPNGSEEATDHGQQLCQHHLHVHQDDIRDFIIEKIRQDTKPAAIISGMSSFLLASSIVHTGDTEC